MSDIKVKVNLSHVLKDKNGLRDVVDDAIKASMELIVSEYVDEAPGNIGNFKQGIRVKKRGVLDYLVESTATERGENYPLFLYTGTGRLRGAADYGYTSGRVRSGDVAYGIGGIRPNKAAKRAKENVEARFMAKVKLLTSRAINK